MLLRFDSLPDASITAAGACTQKLQFDTCAPGQVMTGTSARLGLGVVLRTSPK